MPSDNSQPNGPPPQPNSPDSGQTPQVRDIRQRSEELTRQSLRDPEAERAFILTKIETVKQSPHLTDEERTIAIENLKSMLDNL